MIRSDHERARELIALTGAKDQAFFEAREQTWLRTHLQECASCREYAEATGRVVRALRSQPLAADSELVRTTQIRVRSRALELRQQRERTWMVSLSCVFVGLSAAITTPLSWRAFEWIGECAGVSTWVWQTSFTFFWIAPALLVSVLLLARGTYLSNHEEKYWG
jgi:predicted anti-sigma-YlaC factor YlaD